MSAPAPQRLAAESNRRRVLSFAQAWLYHGGEGALHVLLWRRDLTGTHGR